MSIQTTIPFQIRKSFYGKKDPNSDDFAKQDFTNATLRNTPTVKFQEVRKVMEILEDSDQESDNEDGGSDTKENTEALNIVQTPKKSTKKKVQKPKVMEPLEPVTPRQTRSCRKKVEEVMTPKTPKTPKRKDKTETKNEGSPPKQKKVSDPETPVVLLEKMNLKTPKKEKLSPKQLFTPNLNKYATARKALESEEDQDLPGRQEELEKLNNFIEQHLREKTSASLYVSGTPGTGKTACLSKVMSQYEKNFKLIYINCTSLKSSAAVYSKIAEEMKIKESTMAKCKTKIEEHLTKSQKPLLFILDEIDMLESKNQSILYTIFEWPSLKKSKLVLIGIANSLDLTDRILPRLQTRCEMKPELLHFAPYSKQQIIDIITEKLKKADVLDVIRGPAMQLLAAKVAAVNGDVRRALDMCKRVIELAQDSSKKLDHDTLANNLESFGDKKVEEKPVDFKEVREVINGVYGGSANADREEKFPIQQKLLLCSLMLILNHSKNKNVTIGSLHTVYVKVCKKQNTAPLDMSEFATICSLIEMTGIIKVVPKKDTKLSIVGLTWDQETLCSALQDQNLTSKIIDDRSCL